MDNNYDKSIHSNPDAKAWAKFFIETISKNKEIEIDEDYMLGWFANSMMAMHDHIHNGEIQTLRAKVASAGVLVEALSTIRHNAYMAGSINKTVGEIFRVADKAIITYDKLSEGKHDTNK